MNRTFKTASAALAVGLLSLGAFASASANTADVTVTASAHALHAAEAHANAVRHQRMANAWKSAQAGTRPAGARSVIEHCERVAARFRAEATHHEQLTFAAR